MVLIVDDEHNNLFLIGKFLERLGFQFHTATNGEEALVQFSSHHYNLVLLDIQMPKMNGIECAKAIRKLEVGKKKTPIIALTAQIFREELNKYQFAGIDDYLIKPFDPTELREKKKEHHNPESKAEKDKSEGRFPRKYDLKNLDYAHSLGNGDKSFLVELLSTIFEDFPIYLNELGNAWRAKDYPLVKRTAHKINSPLSNIGLSGLHSISYFENLDTENINIHESEQIISDLNSLIERVLIEIKTELNS